MSKGRSATIRKHTLKLMPDADICIPEEEAPLYRNVCDNLLLPHPPVTSGAMAVQWVLDTIPDEIVWFFDDDITCLVSMTGRNLEKYTHPDDIDQVLENTTEMALGAGAHRCGFPMTEDPKAYISMNPIRLCANVSGSSHCQIGRTIRRDPHVSHNADVDMTLQHLLHHRIVLVDTRFVFRTVKRQKNVGGDTSRRSEESYQRGRDYMEQKWGQYVVYGNRLNFKGKVTGTRTTYIRVQRRQPGVS